VLDPGRWNQLGTAVQSGRALFLYGPTGTGKTTVAVTLMQLFDLDRGVLPHAVRWTARSSRCTTRRSIRSWSSLKSRPPTRMPAGVLCRRPRVMVGRRVDHRDAGSAVQPKYQVLHRAAADEGQQMDFSSWMTSADSASARGVAQPLGGPPLTAGSISSPWRAARRSRSIRPLRRLRHKPDPAKMVDEAFLRRIQTRSRWTSSRASSSARFSGEPA